MRYPFWIVISCLCLIFLSSCSHLSRKDGAPNDDIDVSRIPDASPRPEPLAKYGNYNSYVVFGKRYYTLKNSNHYNQVGTASWYGTKFHAHKTSSGEPYNMLAMTAAHKTLPLPTYVEVTNLKNNRKIIVKVNDRGPFAPNRIIDLSYVAAKKLGMIGHGTTQVRVKAINPYDYYHEPFFAHSSKTPSRSAVFASNHPHEKTYPGFHPAYEHSNALFLQVGAFRQKDYALKLQRRVTALSSTPVKIISPSHSEGLYKVKMGPFRNREALTKITAQLKNLGIRIDGA
jgi:rare lipoprotein A